MSDKDRYYTPQEAELKAFHMGRTHEETADAAVGLASRFTRLDVYCKKLEEFIKSLMLSDNAQTQSDIALTITESDNPDDLLRLLHEAGDWEKTDFMDEEPDVGIMSAGYGSAECLTTSISAIMDLLPDKLNERLIEMACED